MEINNTQNLFLNAISYSDKFDWIEYSVFAAVLIVSAGIGIFYGCFGSKQSTTNEYLLANKKMSAGPVALSLLCSFVSGITLLGHPSEIYLYGGQHTFLMFSFIPMTIVLMYFYVPVYYDLKVESCYEYLELRFNRPTRVVVSVLGILYWMIYMAVVCYGPSLALEQVSGMNRRISTGVIFIVCIFYSSLGGLKTVLWTDTFQAIVIFGSMCFVAFKGLYDIGLDVAWERFENNERAHFFNFDFDIRTRHSFFTTIVGGYFWYITLFAATHSQVQRYLSMPNMKTVKKALLLNMVAIMFVIFLCSVVGFVLYAKYYECDPIKSKRVKNSDQILPLFVMETMGDFNGVPGLFVAGITCGSLSTISSGLNAVAAIITYDYLVKYFPRANDKTLSNFSKVVCLLFGSISYALVFAAEHMGNLVPVWNFLIGLILAPSLGVFTLGMFFPFANSKGSLAGMFVTLPFMAFVLIGTLLPSVKEQLPNQRLPTSIANCSAYFPSNVDYANQFLQYTSDQSNFNYTQNHFGAWKNAEYSNIVNLFSLSYVWYSTIACLLTVIMGLFFSGLFIICGIEKRKPVQRKYLSPPMIWFWIKVCPKEIISKWIDLRCNECSASGSSNFNQVANGHTSSINSTNSINGLYEMKEGYIFTPSPGPLSNVKFKY